MSTFDLQIRYPHHSSEAEADQFNTLDPNTVLAHFDALNLRKNQVQQLQLDGPSLTFSVTDQNRQDTFTLTLKAYEEGDEYQFKMDTNIELVIPQKNVFGLLTVNTKHRIHHKQIGLSQARECLGYFVDGYIDKLKAMYMVYHNTPKATKTKAVD